MRDKHIIMYKAKLGDYLLFNNDLCQVISKTDEPTITIQTIKNVRCPHCEGDIGQTKINIIVDSKYFQDSARPIKTITKQKPIEDD